MNAFITDRDKECIARVIQSSLYPIESAEERGELSACTLCPNRQNCYSFDAESGIMGGYMQGFHTMLRHLQHDTGIYLGQAD